MIQRIGFGGDAIWCRGFGGGCCFGI